MYIWFRNPIFPSSTWHLLESKWLRGQLSILVSFCVITKIEGCKYAVRPCTSIEIITILSSYFLDAIINKILDQSVCLSFIIFFLFKYFIVCMSCYETHYFVMVYIQIDTVCRKLFTALAQHFTPGDILAAEIWFCRTHRFV